MSISAPIEIAGCELWLDAADFASFTFGTGTKVAQWNDKSGNARHVAQATAGQQPTRTIADFGARAGVRFVASASTQLKTSSAATIAQPYTIFVVGSIVAAGTATRVLSHRTTTGVQVTIGESSANGAIFAGTAFITQGSPPAGYTPQQISAIGNGASSQVWSNGTAGTAGNAGTGSLDLVTIGSRGDNSLYLNGEIAEVIVYSGALSSGDRQDVEVYLAAKWVTPDANAPRAEVVAADAFTSSGTISSTDVPLPAHLKDDILAITVATNATGNSIDEPSGWTAVGAASGTTNVTTRMFWARATSDNQFGSSVNVTHSTFRRTSAVSQVIRGASTTVNPYGSKSTSTNDVTVAPDITVTGDNTLLIAQIGYRTEGQTWPIDDTDWAEDDAADGGSGTDTGARCGHRTARVNAGAYLGENLWNGSASNNADCWGLAIESQPLGVYVPRPALPVPVLRGRRR